MKMDRTEPRKHVRRRNYFIDESFQGKFILKFCGLVAMGSLITMGVLYIASRQSSTVAITDSRIVVKTTVDYLWPILIQTVIIVTAIVSLATIAVTLFVSHKIAGPLYHIKMGMKSLESGNFSEDFHIRHLDQIQDLATTFNAMIRKIRGELKALKEVSVSLHRTIDAISPHDLNHRTKMEIAELKSLSSKFNKIISYFKI